MLELNKRTILAANSTGPKLGRYRFRIQELDVGDSKEYFVSYKEGGWLGNRIWIIPNYYPRATEPFTQSYDSDNAAMSSFEQATTALEWARVQVAEHLKTLRVSKERRRLKTISEDR